MTSEATIKKDNKIQESIEKTRGISSYARSELARMHRELTDDNLIEENKRIKERTERLQEKMDDTGYIE